MNALEKAKKLIAGRVDYEDLCRYAAHNLAERQAILSELNQSKRSKLRSKKISSVRVDYLKRQLRDLSVEKSLLETKEARIRPHVSSEHQFII